MTATRSLGLTARSGAPTHLPRGRPPLTLGWWRTSGKFGTYPVAGYAVPMNATTAVEAADERAAEADAPRSDPEFVLPPPRGTTDAADA